jgi:hypothetical protein
MFEQNVDRLIERLIVRTTPLVNTKFMLAACSAKCKRKGGEFVNL